MISSVFCEKNFGPFMNVTEACADTYSGIKVIC